MCYEEMRRDVSGSFYVNTMAVKLLSMLFGWLI
jgi:hypothetical protein